MKQRQMTNSQDSTDGRNVRHFVSDKKPQLLADRRNAFLHKFWEDKGPEERSRISRERSITRNPNYQIVREFIISLIPEDKKGEISLSPKEVHERVKNEKQITVSHGSIRKHLKRLIQEGLLRPISRREHNIRLRKAFEERDRDSATVYVKKFIQSLIPPGKEGRVSVSPIEIQRSLAEKGQTFSKHIINKAIYGLIKQGKLRKMTRTERTTINRNVWRTASEEMRKRHHDGVVTAWGRRTPEEKSEIRSKSASKQWENKTGFTNLSYLEKMPILNRFSGRQALKMFEDCFMRFSGIKVTSEKTSLTINPLRSFSNNPLKEDIQSEYWKAVWYAIVIWNGERNLDELIADSIIFHMIRFFRQEKKERTSIVGMEPNIAERVNARRSTSQEG